MIGCHGDTVWINEVIVSFIGVNVSLNQDGEKRCSPPLMLLREFGFSQDLMVESLITWKTADIPISYSSESVA